MNITDEAQLLVKLGAAFAAKDGDEIRSLLGGKAGYADLLPLDLSAEYVQGMYELANPYLVKSMRNRALSIFNVSEDLKEKMRHRAHEAIAYKDVELAKRVFSPFEDEASLTLRACAAIKLDGDTAIALMKLIYLSDAQPNLPSDDDLETCRQCSNPARLVQSPPGIYLGACVACSQHTEERSDPWDAVRLWNARQRAHH